MPGTYKIEPWRDISNTALLNDLEAIVNAVESNKPLPPVNGGDNGNYYDITLSNKDGQEIVVRCLDVIEYLKMTFPEGEAFKALWRKSAARLGNAKKDHDPLYDAKKVRFYGESIERMALKEANEGV